MTGASWWRRSRWGLLALAVLVPASLAAALSVDAVEYWNGSPRTAVEVPAGQTASFQGAQLRVLESWTATADSPEGQEYGVPEGTALVSVTFELDASAASEEFGCRTVLLEQRGDRRWTSSYGGGTDYWPGRDLPEDVPTTCSYAETAFPFEEVFLVPEDAVGHLVVEVVTPAELPRVFHLRLE